MTNQQNLSVSLSAPKALSNFSDIPGNNKVVLVHKNFPKNIYVVSSDIGICNIYVVNMWDNEIIEALQEYFNVQNWEEKAPRPIKDHTTKAYLSKDKSFAAFYSYKNNTQKNAPGLNVFITFGILESKKM